MAGTTEIGIDYCGDKFIWMVLSDSPMARLTGHTFCLKLTGRCFKICGVTGQAGFWTAQPDPLLLEKGVIVSMGMGAGSPIRSDVSVTGNTIVVGIDFDRRIITLLIRYLPALSLSLYLSVRVRRRNQPRKQRHRQHTNNQSSQQGGRYSFDLHLESPLFLIVNSVSYLVNVNTN